MNDKLGLDKAFLDEANPYDLFNIWMAEAEKSEINDPNALSVATVDATVHQITDEGIFPISLYLNQLLS